MQWRGVHRLSVCLSVCKLLRKSLLLADEMAGSLSNFHKMDSRSACIQGVLKVKVKGHVIRALSWILGMSYSVIDGLANSIFDKEYKIRFKFCFSYFSLLGMWRSQPISTSIRCGFHVQIPSDADADVVQSKLPAIIATAIQLSYLKLNSCKLANELPVNDWNNCDCLQKSAHNQIQTSINQCTACAICCLQK